MSKNKKNFSGIVYSTDPGFVPESLDTPETDTLAPSAQPLRIRLDTKQRAGKAVTLVEGFTGRLNDLEELGKKLRNHCGAGGTVKDGQILVQGDHRDKVFQWLNKNGYVKSRK